MTLVKCNVGGVAIAWGEACGPPGRPALAPGESVASDLYLGVGDDAGAARIVERVAVDVEDLGWVYDPGGVRLGRVVSLVDGLMRWCTCAAGADVDVAGGAAGGTA